MILTVGDNDKSLKLVTVENVPNGDSVEGGYALAYLSLSEDKKLFKVALVSFFHSFDIEFSHFYILL